MKCPHCQTGIHGDYDSGPPFLVRSIGEGGNFIPPISCKPFHLAVLNVSA